MFIKLSTTKMPLRFCAFLNHIFRQNPIENLDLFNHIVI